MEFQLLFQTSGIKYQSALLLNETKVPRENHRTLLSH